MPVPCFWTSPWLLEEAFSAWNNFVSTHVLQGFIFQASSQLVLFEQIHPKAFHGNTFEVRIAHGSKAKQCPIHKLFRVIVVTELSILARGESCCKVWMVDGKIYRSEMFPIKIVIHRMEILSASTFESSRLERVASRACWKGTHGQNAIETGNLQLMLNFKKSKHGCTQIYFQGFQVLYSKIQKQLRLLRKRCCLFFMVRWCLFPFGTTLAESIWEADLPSQGGGDWSGEPGEMVEDEMMFGELFTLI